MKRTFSKRALGVVACALVLAAAVIGPAKAGPGGANDPTSSPKPILDIGNHAARASELTVAQEYEAAHAELAKGDPADPAVVIAQARLALYEENCDLAVSLLGHGEAALSDEARLIGDVARGCARVTAATIVDKDEANGIIIRYHDDDDRALGPLLVDTVLKARTSLARDLGVEWKKPTRITVVRDLLSLSAMTGLPYSAAQTTGTVAVAKWGRVAILSPRASNRGFAFRDTLTHELTHLAIAMQSRDRAPLWLHEGVARREEVRWREAGFFDDRPTPESVVLRGMEMKLDLPLDKLGPSIAMLPSADAATVAFAEVTSFVRFFVESSPEGALAKLLVALRETKEVDEALSRTSGETLAQWDVRWRANLARKAKEALSPLLGLGASPPGMGDSRERARLAELLLGRNHPAEALSELDKISPDLLGDPSLRYLRARVLEATGDTKAAESLLEDPKLWVTSYGPCWAMRGRLARARGDGATADASFDQARAHDPLAVESACEVSPAPSSASGGAGSSDGRTDALCDAAKRRNEPDFGRD